MTEQIYEKMHICKRSGFSQKCHIPLEYFRVLKLKIGDYILIQCDQNVFLLNKVYPLKQSLKTISCDQSVCIGSNFKKLEKSYNIIFRRDFEVVSCHNANKIIVNIMFKDIAAMSSWNNAIPHMKFYIKGILMKYGIMNNVIIDCSRSRLCNEIGIIELTVVDTLCGNKIVTKVHSETEIDINEITTLEHTKQCHDFKRLELGGLESVLSFLKIAISSRSFSNFLLTGPQGCGKTSLVKILAKEMDSYLFLFSCDTIGQMSLTEFEKKLQCVSGLAKSKSSISCIIFLKDLDGVTKKNKESAKIFYLLLTILDVTSQYGNVPVFGSATSSKHVLAELRTHKCFDKEIYIGVPTLRQREDILRVIIDSSLALDVPKIAKLTAGYVASDLSSLYNEAKKIAFESSLEEDGATSPVTTAHFEAAVKLHGQPSVLKNSNFATRVQPVNWEDIGGMQEIKMRLSMMIEWPLLHPEAFIKSGLPCPKGVLLFGPPGCCKTTLVRVLATECNATFFTASPAQIYSPYVGDSEKSIIELFRQARLCAPSIIFLDEIDNLVGRRSYDNKHRGVQEKVLSALLNEMDGFGVHSESAQGVEENVFESDESQVSNENIIVIGATNRVDFIDDALLRPGRFDSILYVPPPNAMQREAILKLQTKKMHLQDVDLAWIAHRTENFSGADLKNLCRIVSLSAFKNNTSVAKEHFETALKISRPSVTAKQLDDYQKLADKYSLLM